MGLFSLLCVFALYNAIFLNVWGLCTFFAWGFSLLLVFKGFSIFYSLEISFWCLGHEV